MSSYGVFADFYDDLTLNAQYSERADYIMKVFERLGHDMGLTLDLACGTGNLTLELKRRGVDVYGIDGSAEMLSRAQEKSADENLGILFLCQQMQSIDLYGTIDTCICTLDSINHMTDKADVQSTFERVSLFMNKGGYFLFDVNTVYKHRNVLADNTFVYDTDDVFCVWQNSLKENNIVDIELTFFERDGDAYFRTDEGFCERAYSHEDLSEMLSESGFEIVAVYGDLGFESPKEDEQRAIYIAKKL
ncbi:MAG: methyltransferase domain-containing protein [Ruminococcus sp.]|nr:methyltransferase domain-containing protein [Ruminococcus sp.]MCH5299400.1 methyltransferase domain-containing protein [Ruminococcus sp.]